MEQYVQDPIPMDAVFVRDGQGRFAKEILVLNLRVIPEQIPAVYAVSQIRRVALILLVADHPLLLLSVP